MNVVITQRVDVVPAYEERRDALDQAWGTTLASLFGPGSLLHPLPNAPEQTGALLAQWQPGVIVLTGGNDLGTAPERDATETRVLDWAADRRVPVLAVCRGMQMVNARLGGALERVPGHVGHTHELAGADGRFGVNSFHNQGIRVPGLAADLTPLLRHADGTIEAARHRVLPWLAVMWHPERSGNDARADAWLAQRVSELLG